MKTRACACRNLQWHTNPVITFLASAGSARPGATRETIRSCVRGPQRRPAASAARAVVRGTEPDRAWSQGFSLHAGVAIAATDRAALERLCRYGARPAFAQDRLTWTDDGRISYRLKRRWHDGRSELILDPIAFLRRLCGIIPPPRRHLVKYHGIFGRAAKHRRLLRSLVPGSCL